MDKILALRRSRLRGTDTNFSGKRDGRFCPFLHCECDNAEMVSVTLRPDENALRRIHRVQALTIAWMSVEAAVSLVAAWIAHSPALLAFGGDSAIELLSAAVVLWAFTRRVNVHHKERRAARLAGILLFVLAGYVTVISVMALLGYNEPEPSYAGRFCLPQQRLCRGLQSRSTNSQ